MDSLLIQQHIDKARTAFVADIETILSESPLIQQLLAEIELLKGAPVVVQPPPEPVYIMTPAIRKYLKKK